MKKLDKILNIKPDNAITLQDTSGVVQEVSNKNEQAEADVAYARENLFDVAEKGKDALYDMIDIARQSQHPKAYEVLNQVLKTLIDVNNNIVDLQIKKQKLERAVDGTDNPAANIMNNLFVGSTAELQQMLMGMKDGNTDN